MSIEETSISRLSRYLNGYIVFVFIVLGLLGNGMSVRVLYNRAMRTHISIYLISLAIWDSVLLVSAFFLTSLGHIVGNTDQLRSFKSTITPVFYPTGLTAQTATIWITVCFTVQRYIAVCHPLKAVTLCTVRKAIIGVFLVSLASILYNLPRWFETIEAAIPLDSAEYMNQSESDLLNVSCTMISFDNTMINFRMVYYTWGYILVMFFVPITTLCTMNYKLIREVQRSRRNRRIDFRVQRYREKNVTLMIICIVSVFIVCQFPALIYNIYFGLHNCPVIPSEWDIVSEIRNFLVILNSSINFVLYCALGQKFRQIFISVFSDCAKHKQDSNNPSYSYRNDCCNQHKCTKATCERWNMNTAQIIQTRRSDRLLLTAQRKPVVNVRESYL